MITCSQDSIQREDLNGPHTRAMQLTTYSVYQGSVLEELDCVLSEQGDKIIPSLMLQIWVYKPSEGSEYSCIT